MMMLMMGMLITLMMTIAGYDDGNDAEVMRWIMNDDNDDDDDEDGNNDGDYDDNMILTIW
jgi:hypothetical protein